MQKAIDSVQRTTDLRKSIRSRKRAKQCPACWILFFCLALIAVFSRYGWLQYCEQSSLFSVHMSSEAIPHASIPDKFPRMRISSSYQESMLNSKSVSPMKFQHLPLGTIKPLGWMNDQMNLMADGLAGHQKDFYHYVNDSGWLGGSSEYSTLNEGFPYWFNGLIPLAYGSGNERLKKQVHDALNYVLDHQQADGWLGPEKTSATRDLWARFPLFLGFIQVLQAEPSQAAELLPSMYRFLYLMHSMLVNRRGFLDYWGEVRHHDMIIALLWLYENRLEIDTLLLTDTMNLLRQHGRDWAHYYNRHEYMFADLDTIQPAVTADSYSYPWVHGVNVAQCES